jgi:hypothetical protein
MEQKITSRLATAEDAPAFVEWAVNNPDIPEADIDAVANSIPLTLVVEVDGQAEVYLPLIPAMTLGYLGFRPGQDVRTKAVALNAMAEALQNLQRELKISDAYVFTKAEYPMGKWALKHGFKTKDKTAFTLEKP